MKRLLPIALLALAGCVTRAEIDEREHQRFVSFNGMTMADFTRSTGLLPSGMQPTAVGRSFAVETATCSMLIETVQDGSASVADTWRIIRIIRRGGCANV